MLFAWFRKKKTISKLKTKGRPDKAMLVEGALTTLRGYKASGITKVTILTCNDNHVCPQCAKLEGTVLTLKKAMEKLPIPNHCTSDDGCRCRYAAVVE